MFFPFCSLSVRGVPLNEYVKKNILALANRLFTEEKENISVKEDGWEAEITTDFKWGQIGCFGGFICWAEVESERGRSQIFFLLRPLNLDITYEKLFTATEALLEERRRSHGLRN